MYAIPSEDSKTVTLEKPLQIPNTANIEVDALGRVTLPLKLLRALCWAAGSIINI